jgi:hypothetical protein
MWQPDEVWCGYAFRGIAAPLRLIQIHSSILLVLGSNALALPDCRFWLSSANAKLASSKGRRAFYRLELSPL